MRKIFTTMIALAMFATTASAQQGGGRPEKPTPEQMTERMTEQLGLSDEQKGKVLELNTEYQDVAGGFHGGGPMGPPPEGFSGGNHGNGNHQPPELTEEQKAKMEEMKTKREEYNTKLKAILTEEQYTKYETIHRHGPKPGHGPGNHPGGKKDKDNNKNKDKKK